MLRAPRVLSRQGSAQGDATRRRLGEGLRLTGVFGTNFPRADSYFCLETRPFPWDGSQLPALAIELAAHAARYGAVLKLFRRPTAKL